MLKIGILGPESTGKSTLCAALQDELQLPVIPEYARTYVAQLNRPYTYDDVCHIAEQNRKEANSPLRALSLAGCLFDTELIITAVWFDEVYGRRPDWLTSPVPEDCQMDLYLLLYPDLPWVADPVRENGSDDRRLYLFNRYLEEVQKTGRPYAIIRGEGEERLTAALAVIRRTDPILFSS